MNPKTNLLVLLIVTSFILTDFDYPSIDQNNTRHICQLFENPILMDCIDTVYLMVVKKLLTNPICLDNRVYTQIYPKFAEMITKFDLCRIILGTIDINRLINFGQIDKL